MSLSITTFQSRHSVPALQRKRYRRIREPGLSAALDVAGGVTRLAQTLGIAQASVSNWKRIPDRRLAEVQAVTGLCRHTLRPDLRAREERKLSRLSG
jgi:DNA-binding transcriptional regulator YdaS (Cro superfamily)